MSQQRINQIKRKIEQDNIDLGVAKQQQQNALQKLKEEFDCKTMEEAEKKLDTLQKQANKLDADLTDLFDKIESEYCNA